MKSSDFSFLLDWPLFLHFFSFFSAPYDYTCSGFPILLLLFSFSFNFFVLFWCPRELLLTKLNLSKRFSILTYQTTHVANYCPHLFDVFFFFLFFNDIALFFFLFLFSPIKPPSILLDNGHQTSKKMMLKGFLTFCTLGILLQPYMIWICNPSNL